MSTLLHIYNRHFNLPYVYIITNNWLLNTLTYSNNVLENLNNWRISLLGNHGGMFMELRAKSLTTLQEIITVPSIQYSPNLWGLPRCSQFHLLEEQIYSILKLEKVIDSSKHLNIISKLKHGTIIEGISITYMLNKIGPRTEPCGTPLQ